MTNKENKVRGISDKDLEKWLEFAVSGVVTSVAHEKELKRLASSKVNLGDVTSVVDFLGRRNEGYTSMVIERLSVLEIALKNKIGLTDEEIKEATAEYNENLTKFQAEVDHVVEKEKEKVNAEGHAD